MLHTMYNLIYLKRRYSRLTSDYNIQKKKNKIQGTHFLMIINNNKVKSGNCEVYTYTSEKVKKRIFIASQIQTQKNYQNKDFVYI